MSVSNLDCITRVSVQSSSDYMPRVRRIIECMADSVGMDAQECTTAEMVLTEVCSDTITKGGAGDAVSITLWASKGTIIADVVDQNACDSLDDVTPNIGARLKKVVSDSVQLIRHKTGLTLTLTKRKKATSRLCVIRPSAHHRN